MTGLGEVRGDRWSLSTSATRSPKTAAEFEDAYRRASAILETDPHCVAYEIARGVEEPRHFIVRIEWDSVEGHEQGFRSSAHFGEFFAAVKPFFSEIEEMKHYTVRVGGVPSRR